MKEPIRIRSLNEESEEENIKIILLHQDNDDRRALMKSTSHGENAGPHRWKARQRETQTGNLKTGGSNQSGERQSDKWEARTRGEPHFQNKTGSDKTTSKKIFSRLFLHLLLNTCNHVASNKYKRRNLAIGQRWLFQSEFGGVKISSCSARLSVTAVRPANCFRWRQQPSVTAEG